MSQVFISYRRSTSAVLAQLLRQELKSHNIDAFVDVRDIEGTGPFPEKLAQAIIQAKTLICLLAETTLDSQWVQEELRVAFENGKTLIPVFQESYQQPQPPYSEPVAALLLNQGVQVFDTRGLYIEETVQRIIALLKPLTAESNRFSTPIRSQMASLNKIFGELTKDQFQIINTMRRQKRLRIAGCAGSGKTLIAAEKAIRLDAAGLKTMILCHSAYLAGYIQKLVAGTSVDVMDFTSWIHRVLEVEAGKGEEWTHYDEPTSEELSAAFDCLVESNDRYEAILVDEGQDFRNEWWIIIESALTNPETGILYIFHDDNQALLPGRAEYPISQPPIILSKNCRNAGEVFELVRKFHPQSPETSMTLKKQGVVKQWDFTTSEGSLSTVSEAVQDALSLLTLDQLIVLTTEPEPVSQSFLEGLSITLSPAWKWQDVVRRFLGDITLSDEPYPTNDDILNVQEVARQTTPPGIYESQTKLVKWMASDDQLSLSHPFGVHFKRARHFFQSDDWAVGIPHPKVVRITSLETESEDIIRLSTVSSYKGLESDGVVLFVPAIRVNDLEANIYVGVSRARFLLHLVIDGSKLRRIRQMQG